MMEPHIIIELIGGADDGTYLDSRSDNRDERDAAVDYFETTDGGTIGETLVFVADPFADEVESSQSKKFSTGYVVADRIEDNGNVFLQMRYFCVELNPNSEDNETR